MPFGLKRRLWKGWEGEPPGEPSVHTARQESRPPLNKVGICLKSYSKRYNMRMALIVSGKRFKTGEFYAI